jgi:DNA polymerase-3 subunit delta'
MGWQVDAEDGAADGEGKSRAKPSGEIKVDAIRQAVAFSQQTSSRGIAKVVLIYPAEQMNLVAANTLLKTLEEPPGAARFVLASGSPDRLLPTVRSRCQALDQALPERSVALQWLAAHEVNAPEIMLAASGGQPLAALAMVEQGIDARLWEQIPQQVMSGVPGQLASWPVSRVVQVLLKLCNDALRASSGRTPIFFPSQAIPVGANLLKLTTWAAELRKFMRHAEHPLNASLQIEALIQRARQALSVQMPDHG